MNHRTEVRLNKSFYSLKAIEEAAQAFKDICSAQIAESSGSHHTIMLIEKIQTDAEEMKKEFCNYCLASMKRQGSG
jgi:biotin synthase-related radical SAM superfamily protein